MILLKKHYAIVYNLVFIVISILLSIIALSSFTHVSFQYSSISIEIKIAMMNTILFFFVLFYVLMFIIDYNLYIITCACVIIIGIPSWIYIYYIELNFGDIFLLSTEMIENIIAILCFSILSPGLTLFIIQFIRRKTSKYEENRILGTYHVHEGFIGVLLIVIAFFLWIIRILLIQREIFKTTLRVFLGLDMIVLFVVLYCGSFLVFRDWRDVLHLNFFEKKEENNDIINNNEKNNNSTVFNHISSDSIQFFKRLRVKIYPIGILLVSFSANALIHGLDLFPKELFNLELETIVLIGCACCFLGAGTIGLDWYNLFARIYPERQEEIDRTITALRE